MATKDVTFNVLVCSAIITEELYEDVDQYQGQGGGQIEEGMSKGIQLTLSLLPLITIMIRFSTLLPCQ